jgi:hypothetical protein
MEDECMENMDNIRERFEALERQTQMVEQRLRWWRGIASGVLVLALLSLALPSGKAADTQPRGMAERMATVEKELAAMDFDEAANEVVITGANLRIVNGLGTTESMNGSGNLIVGYNELRSSFDCHPTNPLCIDVRTGSHNVVVGDRHNFSSFGGVVVGRANEISGVFASVTGGVGNTASGPWSSVSGGNANTASGQESSVNGGVANTASGQSSSVNGGIHNVASGEDASISGGFLNTAKGLFSSVGGGENNTASGESASVSGGLNRTAPAQFNWAAGALFSDQ